jgi:hypothetical protein
MEDGYNALKLAMEDEYNAFMRNKTWRLVPLQTNRNIIDYKWVYKVKHKANWSIDCYKACLVAKGIKQQLGIDYDVMFSPVVKPATFGWFYLLSSLKDGFFTSWMFKICFFMAFLRNVFI